MKTILVTGGTGFVGRALVPLLAARGYAVRLALREASPLFQDAAVVGSIGPETDWSGALDGIDAVVHLAARVHVMDDRSGNPLAAFRKVNTEGTLRLAEAARNAGAARFVFMSSIKAAGERSGDVPLSENMPARPETPYGQSKLEAEEGLMAMHGLHAVILRPPLVYGPGVKGNFRTLMNVVMRGIPLPLASVFNQRSLIFSGNLADAALAALECADLPAGRYHVCDGAPVSTPDLLKGVAAAAGRRVRLVPFPPALLRLAAKAAGAYPAWERVCGNLVVDDRAFRQKAAWVPPFSMEEGLALAAEWHKAYLEGRTE